MNYVLNVIEYIFLEHLDATSFVLSILSILIGYWFWKNPLSTEIIKKRCFTDKNGDIRFISGINHKGWIVKRFDTELSNKLDDANIKTGPIEEYASRKNNKKVKSPPSTFEELEKLNYSEDL